MTAVAAVDAWLETCLISISFLTEDVTLEFAGLTDTIDFNFGEKDIDPIALCNGGRVTKWTPEGPSEVTLECYPTEAGTSSATDADGTGWFDFLHPDSDATPRDEGVPIRVTNTRTRLKARILFMWTTDTTPTSAEDATASNERGLRIGLAEGYITSVKKSFTDGILKCTIKYKCAAFVKGGGGNVIVESAAGEASDTLPAINPYTTSYKFG